MKKYIDVDAFCTRMKTTADGCTDSDCRDCAVHRAEKVEVPDVVRCIDCINYSFDTSECTWHCIIMKLDDFCSYGERKCEK